MTPALLRAVAWIAGLFSAAILVVLVTNVPHLQPPLDDAQLITLGKSLVERKDPALAVQYRQRDAALRTHYRSRSALQSNGGVLLVAGMLVMVAALRRARTLERRIIDPRTLPPPDPWRLATATRHGVLAGGVLLAACLGGLAFIGRDTTPKPPPEAAAPTAADFAQAWPAFRGLHGDGRVIGPMPGAWDGVSGQGLRWTVEIPLSGMSSPCVWKNQVFVTGGDAGRREVYCFAAADGKALWTGAVPPAPKELEPFADTGFAAPTPVCDGRRVVVLFGDGQLAGFDLSGRRRWLQALGLPASQYTYAASLALWQDLVIVQWDVGSEPGGSALIAYDILTGRQRWRTPRPGVESWSSPVVSADGAVVCNGNPWVAEYDATSGAERWRAKLMESDVAVSPVVAGDRVFVTNTHACLAAIRRGGSGDVTDSHVLWKTDGDLPDQASPVTDGTRLVTSSDAGNLVCRGCDDGKVRWNKTFETIAVASPLVANGRFWLLDEKGVMHVVAAADAFSAVASYPLAATSTGQPEKFHTTPAVVEGVIYVRSNRRLFAIGSKP